MRLSKIMLVTVVLCSISVLSLGCTSKSASTPQGQVITVQRGDLSVTITGVGNLALSNKVDLAFDIPSSFSTASNPLSVEEVPVQAGDSVKEGQLLAKLDTSGWDAQIAALEDKVTAAERTVTTKKRAVTATERQIPAKKLDVLNKQSLVNQAQLDLEDTEERSTDILAIKIAEAKLEVAKGNLEAAQIAVEDAQIAVEDAQTAVEDAKKALENAKKALADAKNASPEVRAPFAGFITNVNVTGGQEVKKGTVAVTLADPDKFEANILVNETNIMKVSLGANATAQLDAVKGAILPAKVTSIAPTGTISSGVVNYKVLVELQSLQPVSGNQSGWSQRTQSATGGQAPFVSGNQSGRSQRTQSATGGQAPFVSGNQSGRSQRTQSATGGQASPAPTQPLKLSEGLTVTISIVIDKRSDVLLVPNGAITSRGGQAYVQVVSPDGTVGERSIQTGISNGQYTEVISDLSEGEQVIIPKATTTTTTTSQQGQQSRGGMPIGIFR